MSIITIHQPQYLPWIPYFAKILQSDLFIFLDNVSFQKNGVQNRNQIKTANGKTWLTVPVKQSFGQLIKDTAVANPHLITKHLKTISLNYRKAPFFEAIFCLIEPLLLQPPSHLSDLNCKLILTLLNYLDYKGKVIYASDLNVQGQGSSLIRNLCLACDVRHYLSGQGGKSYMDLNDFNQHHIDVYFHRYEVKPYPQCFPAQPFMNDLSIIDLLFSLGPESRAHIQLGQLACEKF